MTLTDYMYQEKKEKDDLLALKTRVDALIQRLEDYIQMRGGILIIAPSPILTTRRQTERQ